MTYACVEMIGRPTIYTIGHSVHLVDRFVELLQEQQIDVLADIRSTPSSRFSPQFNRDRLKDALITRGIKYVFLGKELGGRPKWSASGQPRGQNGDLQTDPRDTSVQ